MESCPCGSGKTYQACCAPFHAGTAKAPSAEALMRSRYSAYSKHQIQYIMDTYTKKDEDSIDPEGTRKWAEESTWLGLEIVSTDKGGFSDETGTVEFIATYVQRGIQEKHHEVASFVKQNGGWLYDTGKIIPTTKVRVGEKIGRNDPCSCGSGKKYKHCHGK